MNLSTRVHKYDHVCWRAGNMRRIRGDTQARQPFGLAAVSATGAVPRSRWRRRGGSPIADPRGARVRSGPRRSPLCFITRRFAPRTMLTGIAFVVAPRSRGRRARRIRSRIHEPEYLVSDARYAVGPAWRLQPGGSF